MFSLILYLLYRGSLFFQPPISLNFEKSGQCDKLPIFRVFMMNKTGLKMRKAWRLGKAFMVKKHGLTPINTNFKNKGPLSRIFPSLRCVRNGTILTNFFLVKLRKQAESNKPKLEPVRNLAPQSVSWYPACEGSVKSRSGAKPRRPECQAQTAAVQTV